MVSYFTVAKGVCKKSRGLACHSERISKKLFDKVDNEQECRGRACNNLVIVNDLWPVPGTLAAPDYDFSNSFYCSIN